MAPLSTPCLGFCQLRFVGDYVCSFPALSLLLLVFAETVLLIFPDSLGGNPPFSFFFPSDFFCCSFFYPDSFFRLTDSWFFREDPFVAQPGLPLMIRMLPRCGGPLFFFRSTYPLDSPPPPPKRVFFFAILFFFYYLAFLWFFFLLLRCWVSFLSYPFARKIFPPSPLFWIFPLCRGSLFWLKFTMSPFFSFDAFIMSIFSTPFFFGSFRVFLPGSQRRALTSGFCDFS